jgi:hypothetical protein
MNSEIKYLIYKTPQEVVSVNAVVKGETIWLTQKAMAELFNCSTDNISLHLKNIFAEGKLEKIQLPRKSRQLHNVIRQTQNDVTISKMETVHPFSWLIYIIFRHNLLNLKPILFKHQ